MNRFISFFDNSATHKKKKTKNRILLRNPHKNNIGFARLTTAPKIMQRTIAPTI